MKRGEAAIDRLREIQLIKFEMNEHKGEWKEVDARKLFALLCLEVNELKMAIDYDGKVEEIVRECADVANFAVMIADVVRR